MRQLENLPADGDCQHLRGQNRQHAISEEVTKAGIAEGCPRVGRGIGHLRLTRSVSHSSVRGGNATVKIHRMHGQELTTDFLAAGLVWYVVFLLSTTCHEAAHALAAKWGRDLTAFHGGQVSLDPLPHIRREMFGMVIFPVLSYVLGGWMMGWASAPYDPLWADRHPRRAAWMSLAGPGANFTLTILAALAIRAGILMGAFEPPDAAGFTHIVTAATPGAAGGAATFF